NRASFSASQCSMTWLLLALMMCEEASVRPLATSITIDVKAGSNVPAAVVKHMLDESRAIWKAAGVHLQWDLPSSRSIHNAIDVHLIVDDGDGGPRGREPALGWIVFDGSGIPEPVIHVSRQNGMEVFERIAPYRTQAYNVQEVMVGRALGRALAHE